MADVKARGRAPAPVVPKPPKSNHKKPFSALIKRLTSLRSTPSSSHLTSDGFNSTKSSSSASRPSTSKTRSTTSRYRTRPSSASAGELSSLYPGRPTPTPSRASVDSHLTRPLSITSASSVNPSSATMTTTTSSHPSDFSRTPSIRSMTTFTTIHSIQPLAYNPHPHHHFNPNAPPVQYTNPMPAPSNPNLDNLAPNQTYSSATANGLLTDNASVITLASSHRRRSFDTDASVRALAPRSVWGGSRESLPLSILSQNLERGERASLYGRALETASRQAVDLGSPLGSPNRESFMANRRSGGWGELGESSGGGSSVNYSAGYGGREEDGRSFKSGVGSVRGSLRSKRSNGRMTEVIDRVTNSGGGGYLKEGGATADAKGKGKEVLKDDEDSGDSSSK